MQLAIARRGQHMQNHAWIVVHYTNWKDDTCTISQRLLLLEPTFPQCASVRSIWLLGVDMEARSISLACRTLRWTFERLSLLYLLLEGHHVIITIHLIISPILACHLHFSSIQRLEFSKLKVWFGVSDRERMPFLRSPFSHDLLCSFSALKGMCSHSLHHWIRIEKCANTHLNVDSLWDVCLHTSRCESSGGGSGSTCPQGQK